MKMTFLTKIALMMKNLSFYGDSRGINNKSAPKGTLLLLFTIFKYLVKNNHSLQEQ